MKLYRRTRTTKTHVWLRWDAYGPTRRGLSILLTWADFKANYAVRANLTGYPEDDRWFKLSHVNPPKATSP
jgi:hypothetical protein